MGNAQIMDLGPDNITPVIPGHIVSASANIEAALFMVMDYLQSTYNLQAADTALEADISNAEAELVTAFQNQLINPDANSDNYIYLLEHLDPSKPDYATQVARLTTLYNAASAKNQSLVTFMNGDNSVAQNTLSQNAQGVQGLLQTMGSVNGVEGNLSRLVQG